MTENLGTKGISCVKIAPFSKRILRNKCLDAEKFKKQAFGGHKHDKASKKEFQRIMPGYKLLLRKMMRRRVKRAATTSKEDINNMFDDQSISDESLSEFSDDLSEDSQSEIQYEMIENHFKENELKRLEKNLSLEKMSSEAGSLNSNIRDNSTTYSGHSGTESPCSLEIEQHKQARVISHKYDKKLKDYFYEIEVPNKSLTRHTMKLGRNELLKEFPLALIEYYEDSLGYKI